MKVVVMEPSATQLHEDTGPLYSSRERNSLSYDTEKEDTIDGDLGEKSINDQKRPKEPIFMGRRTMSFAET